MTYLRSVPTVRRFGISGFSQLKRAYPTAPRRSKAFLPGRGVVSPRNSTIPLSVGPPGERQELTRGVRRRPRGYSRHPRTPRLVAVPRPVPCGYQASPKERGQGSWHGCSRGPSPTRSDTQPMSAGKCQHISAVGFGRPLPPARGDQKAPEGRRGSLFWVSRALERVSVSGLHNRALERVSVSDYKTQ